MCTLNSFYLQNFLQNFLHTPYHTVHGPGSHHHGLQSQIRHWENCWLEIISPELMFVFLISLTSISEFQSKGQLLFNVNGNNSFLLCPRYLAQVGCMKVSQLKSSVQKLFRSIKLSSHLHTINACGACIITVVRRSADNSMLHKRLK